MQMASLLLWPHSSSGDRNGRYWDQVPLANSTWRIVLAAPDGPLFASVSGLHKWVPWLLFVAFALVAAMLVAAVAARTVSPTELVDHYLDRIERLDGQIGAFVTVTAGTSFGLIGAAMTVRSTA